MHLDFEYCCELMEKRVLYFMQGKSLGAIATLRIRYTTKFFVQKGSIIHVPCSLQNSELEKLFQSLKMNNLIEKTENTSLVKLLEDVPLESISNAASFVLGRSSRLFDDYQPWSLIKDVPLIPGQVFEELKTKFNSFKTLPGMFMYYFERLSRSCMINFILELKNSCKDAEDASLKLLQYIGLYDEYFNGVYSMRQYVSSRQPNQYVELMRELSLNYCSIEMKSVFLNLKNKAKQREVFEKLYDFQTKKKEYQVMEFLFEQFNELKQMDAKDYNNATELCDTSNNLTDNYETQNTWLSSLVSSITHLFQLTDNCEKHQYHITLHDKIK